MKIILSRRSDHKMSLAARLLYNPFRTLLNPFTDAPFGGADGGGECSALPKAMESPHFCSLNYGSSSVFGLLKTRSYPSQAQKSKL